MADVPDDLGWALGVVFRAYIKAADAELSGFPGGTRGYRMLCGVAHHCPSSQLALAQLTGLDRTVVTYLIDDLAAVGLVERTADPADRRTRRVTATDKGRELLSSADARLRAVEDRLLGGLVPADREVMRSLLMRVALRIQNEGAEAFTCASVEALNNT